MKRKEEKADIYAWIDGEEPMEKKRGIDSFTLHILAMLFMLCDHLWATLFPAQEWMTCVGRLAFPIYDRRRMLLYFECEKIHAASFSICHNFRNTI